VGIQSIYREESTMLNKTPDPKPTEDVEAHGGHWPDPADDIEAGLRHPAPEAGLKHPAPEAGLKHPAPEAGYKHPAPEAGIKHPAPGNDA
jgi:transcription elongation factor